MELRFERRLTSKSFAAAVAETNPGNRPRDPLVR
jgi:hypothetical protein